MNNINASSPRIPHKIYKSYPIIYELEYAKIPLSKNCVGHAIVDLDDVNMLSQFSFCESGKKNI